MKNTSPCFGLTVGGDSRQHGFTLVELMIIVAIVSILAVIAMPAYQNYTIRSKVSEAMAFMAEAKSTVTERYSATNTMPTSNQVAGLAPPDSYDDYEYVSRLEVTSIPVDGTIVVTVKIPGTSANGKQLQLVPSTSSMPIVWRCESVPDINYGIAATHIPANCRG
ncbi:MAG: pilin [Halieaceae bacterium]|jgi:type IV pilus assembly protein PilA|nr:pilin [Halieaceae bacterium]